MRHVTLVSLVSVLLILISTPIAVWAQDPLTETYVSKDGTLTFDHPAGWVFENMYGVTFFANKRSALSMILGGSNFVENLTPGDLTGEMMEPYQFADGLVELNLESNVAPNDIFRAIQQYADEQSPEITVGDPVEIDLGGKPAAYIKFTAPPVEELNIEELDNITIIVQVGENAYVSLTCRTKTDELDPFIPTLLDMAESMTYSPAPVLPLDADPPLTQTYHSTGNTLTFDYPQGWAADPFHGLSWMIVLSNERRLIDSLSAPIDREDFTLESGQVLATFLVKTWDELEFDLAGKSSLLTLAEHEAQSPGFAPIFGDSESEVISWDSPNSIQLGETPAVMLKGQNTYVDVLWLTVEADENTVITLWVETYPGESELVEPTIRSIAETVFYTMPLIMTIDGQSESGYDLAFSSDGTSLASIGYYARTLRFWNPFTGEELDQISTDSERYLAMSQDGSTLALYNNTNDNLRLLNTQTREFHQILTNHHEVQDAAFSPDGTLLACARRDQVIWVWEVETGELLTEWEIGDYSVSSLAISPSGDLLANSSKNIVQLWDIESNQLEGELGDESLQFQFVEQIVFSPDGKLLASANDTDTIVIWDLETLEPRAILRHIRGPVGFWGSVETVAFSPDGSLLATGATDDTVRLWDTATFDQIIVLEGHQSWINRVAFSADGRLLASSSGDGTIKLWDIEQALAQAD